MRILIDIGHPAHVHLFRNISSELEKKGHIVFYSIRDMKIVKQLMNAYGLKYYDLGHKRNSLLGKALAILEQDYKLYKFVRKNKIDIGISSGISLPHLSRITPMKSFVFDDDDDDIEPLMVKYGHPFSDVILTPHVIKRKSQKSLYYAGSHELAYLHPNFFTPNVSVIERMGIKKDEPYFIMRFVAFHGHHDVGQSGITFEQKKRMINLIKPYGRIFITSEREIEPELEEYRLHVSPEDIHSFMAYATLVIGDSQTMISEAAVLGIPAIKCNTFAGKLSVPNDLEYKYELCYSYHPKDFDRFYAHIQSLLLNSNLKVEWQKKRAKMLADKINVTAFFLWLIENYPESKVVLKKDPNYQYRFK